MEKETKYNGYTYCISDIHGNYTPFIKILEDINFSKDDRLYILGDVFDNGPEPHLMAKWLLKNANNGGNVIFILGNHEDAMLKSVNKKYKNLTPTNFSDIWIGSKMRGWRTRKKLLDNLDAKEIEELFDILSKAPIMLKIKVANKEFLLSHAGHVPQKNDKENNWLIQDKHNLLWGSIEWLAYEGPLPFEVVFGHFETYDLVVKILREGLTSIPKNMIKEGLNDKMIEWNGRHAIDCGAGSGGNIGCLRLDDGKKWYRKTR